jgi:hypothetical protein
MTATTSTTVTTATASPAWQWPLDLDGYNRRSELTSLEREALHRLGANNLRRRSHDSNAPEWHVVHRLLRPLDDARAAMYCPDTPHHCRSILDAIGLVLLRCAETDTAYWTWNEEDWAGLIGESVADFVRPWPGWIDGTVRPYVTSYAFLIGGFTAFHRVGNLAKLPVAYRVFGKEPVDDALTRIAEVLGRWGYRVAHGEAERLPSTVCLALLLNRSPLLEDLTAEAFDRLRQNVALSKCHVGTLFGIQRAISARGFCSPPLMSVPGTMPAIEGTTAEWAEWIERWYDTSTLTPKVRRMFRGIVAKAARWLADQHPERAERKPVSGSSLGQDRAFGDGVYRPCYRTQRYKRSALRCLPRSRQPVGRSRLPHVVEELDDPPGKQLGRGLVVGRQ